MHISARALSFLLGFLLHHASPHLHPLSRRSSITLPARTRALSPPCSIFALRHFGFQDFSVKDMIAPTLPRSRDAMSAIINFARYKVSNRSRIVRARRLTQGNTGAQ